MTLQPTDYLVAAVMAVIALFPLVAGPAVAFVKRAIGTVRPAALTPVTEQDASTQWRNKWVQTLMELQADLEVRGNGKQQASLKLCKQLIWEILGGGPLA
jgi:hypothetical protein